MKFNKYLPPHLQVCKHNLPLMSNLCYRCNNLAKKREATIKKLFTELRYYRNKANELEAMV